MKALLFKRRRIHVTAMAAALAWTIGAGCGGAEMRSGGETAPAVTSLANPASMTVDRAAQAQKGHQLFLLNCAHCHAPDATGDEGPDLHGVRKSDARIATMIKNGVKGEMPKFGAKLSDDDVQALIAFIRSLPEAS